MKSLEKMMQELCPNGVEFKSLGEIATITRGGSFQKRDFVDCGFPCIHYGQIYTQYNMFVTETLRFIPNDIAQKQRTARKNDIVMAVTSENIDDVCKCVAWLGDGEVAVSGHTAIIHHNQNPKFLVYFFNTEMFHSQKRKLAHGTKVIEVTPDKLNNIKIPIPPLQIQNEIVRMLDDFSRYTSALEADLMAEISARKKQYEYYRNQLLSFGDSCLQSVNVERERERRSDTVRWLSVESICEISRGRVISKDFIRENAGNYPVYSSQTENDGVLGLISEYAYDGEYLTWTTDGANAGTIFYRNGKFSITNVCGLLKPLSKDINIRYLYFVLGITADKYVKRGMGNPKLMSNVMAKIKIPVPALAEQERIVTILDNYSMVYADTAKTLADEIVARKKQYTFYRDSLLNFKEIA